MSDGLSIDLYNRPSPDRLREALRYDETTGEFSWRISTGRVKPGARAGVLKPHGYVFIQVDGRAFGAHRIAWAMAKGEWPAGEIDHINGIRNDNRISNLRDVTRAMNQHNRRSAQANNKTSRFLGVSRKSKTGLWRAVITADGRQIEIGNFETEEEAHLAYVAKKRELHAGFIA